MFADPTPETVRQLLALPAKTEWVEFKHNNAAPADIGAYISALANAAALHGRSEGHLVWGVEDGSHRLLGTAFQPHAAKGAGRESLEPWLARLLSPRINFGFAEVLVDANRVVVLTVQAANTHPVAFQGREWVRVGSHKKPLADYPERERDLWRLLSGPTPDWSAGLCPAATLADLDPAAMAAARQAFRDKHRAAPAVTSEEIYGWSDTEFLNRAKLAVGGTITRAAILLLGRNEATSHLSPAVAHVTWVLKDAAGDELDYAHFGPPFLLTVDDILRRTRNLTLRVMTGRSLIPKELAKYDDWVIREALHNCISHQDYTRQGRVNVVEGADSILFSNLGHFIPGSVERLLEREEPERQYRNPFLAAAMVNLKMIDTIGTGIKRMFRKQQQRSLPMPDYDLADAGVRVRVRIIGKIIDERFTQLLMARTDLPLADVVQLDKVQKRRPISDDAYHALKQKKLIEGRKATPFISAGVAAIAEREAEYIHNRGCGRAHCKRMVVQYLEQFRAAKREKIEEVVFPLLSVAFNDKQKAVYVKNLIQEMRREGAIRKAEGTRSDAVWVLSTPDREWAS